MRSVDTILERGGFVIVCTAVLAAPWFFGAWEMWWFWPFAVCIFISTSLFALRFLLQACRQTRRISANGDTQQESTRDGLHTAENGRRRTDAQRRMTSSGGRKAPRKLVPGVNAGQGINPRLKTFVVLSSIPFLSYAFVRFLQADVFMDAERSFLLFLTPFLVGVHILFGFSRRRLELLFVLVLLDLCLLGLYGIINHVVTGSKLVLWVEGYPQYIRQSRATGSYFCPDHFSGIMELAFCLALGVLAARNTGWRWKLWAALALPIALAGVVLSKSRGGGITIVVVGIAALVWGFSQWPASVRWQWRVSAGALAALAVISFWSVGGAYMARFKNYFEWDRMRELSFQEGKVALLTTLHRTSRGRMISGAVRAWRTQPVFGIGPGMHQNVWPHFAASPDGDRELGVWPTLLNDTFHSYEVHSDWLQLLEEYGLVGLILFLIPASAVFAVLLAGVRVEVRERRKNKWRKTGRKHHALVLAGLFACVCMGFHSLGDFNLQMPATVWLLAVIVAIPVTLVAGGAGREVPA